MEIKVGDYARSSEGDLGKIVRINNSHDIELEDSWVSYDEEDLKSSPNIIGLIEVGDYVNGCYVDEIIGANDSWDDRQHFHLLKFNSYFGNSDIKSIVTKEQFASMEYKVER